LKKEETNVLPPKAAPDMAVEVERNGLPEEEEVPAVRGNPTKFRAVLFSAV
jgi:hypothetical protein